MSTTKHDISPCKRFIMNAVNAVPTAVPAQSVNGLPEDKKARSGFPNGVVLGMVCTNKTLSKEVTHFIYSNNSFYLTLAYHRDWIAQIGKKNSSALHEVILVGGGRPKVAAKQLSAMVASL
ncbi:hypothetical protein NEMBOFW57_008025 [Staphylotrichum longicolle]|uniref:Uncharacterized protein n=1 Tax=Staphylotrichum longicolle TaxID=669026 RepID=A0AAD4EQJ6_9PEZI|nr:hypothetical protein NEMBOFW57_008025 [Staphylotrichum longicolle]